MRLGLRWFIKSLQIKLFQRSRREWFRRDLNSTQKYWTNRNDPNNRFLYDRLNTFQFNSLCEIGSNCGNRLYQIARERPHIKCTGIDINKIAVEYGTARFRELGIKNIELYLNEASDLSRFADDSFDVVFSWATLIYVPPDQINNVLEQMLRIAKKGVVLLETHDELLSDNRQIRGVLVPPGNWKRNYTLLLREKGIDPAFIRLDDVPKTVWDPGGGCAKIITITLSENHPIPTTSTSIQEIA